MSGPKKKCSYVKCFDNGFIFGGIGTTFPVLYPNCERQGTREGAKR